MTQDEKWLQNYNEVISFLNTSHRNLSKYNLDERRLFTWMKHNRKVMNSGGLKPERVEKFKELLVLAETYRRKNQYQ